MDIYYKRVFTFVNSPFLLNRVFTFLIKKDMYYYNNLVGGIYMRNNDFLKCEYKNFKDNKSA